MSNFAWIPDIQVQAPGRISHGMYTHAEKFDGRFKSTLLMDLATKQAVLPIQGSTSFLRLLLLVININD